MTEVTVTTKNELEDAKERGVGTIIVIGDLANKLKKGKMIAYAGAGTLALLTAALIAAPFTAGLSVLGAIPVAALTGLEISGIIAVSAVGLTLVVSVFKGYDEISYDTGKLVLRKKS